jgi:sigma-B regulation protein RsbU (phosphoserine phosphatase)
MNPAELRGILRNDSVGLVLGVLIALPGLLALGLVCLHRRRARLLLWPALFAILYGARLLIRTATFRLYADLPPIVWDHAEAAITYLVPIPIVLFARAIFPAWQRFWTTGAAGLTAFALYGVASDVLRREPFSAAVANNVIAIGFFVGVLIWICRPGLKSSRELRTVRVGALAVSMTAVADNLQGMNVLALPGPDLEPFGFTVLIVCLGTIAAWRVLGESERLAVIDRELAIARQIQSSLLPQSMPRVVGLTITARYRPMTAVAGDFYDFLEVDAERVGILVADVSGHGVPAALIASMVKVAFAAQRENAQSPAAVLTGMNETLCGRLGGQYVTASYLFVDTASHVIRYGAAGHPPMLRLARASGSVDQLEQNGLLLGFSARAPYGELEQPLRKRERFLLYTDGLIEAANAADDLFGLERLEPALAACAHLSPDAAADGLMQTVDTWSGQAPADDLTLLLVDWDAGS